MKNRIVSLDNNIIRNVSLEGERIETKVDRVVHNNEPIKDGAPLIYTERKQGVRPEFNIRTDRFDVAVEAMDKVSKSYMARREERAGKVVEMKPEGKDTAGESVQGKQ